jgi:hypothetical protein
MKHSRTRALHRGDSGRRLARENIMGKLTIITTIFIAAFFVSAARLAPGGGGGTLFVDNIQPGATLTKGGITIQNHVESQGPITATPYAGPPGTPTGWKKIEIQSGEKAVINIGDSAPAADLLKLRILVKGTGRLRLTGHTGRVPKPLGQVPANDPSSSTGIIVSGLGALVLEGAQTDQIVVLREHVVLRTTSTSSGAMIGVDAANAMVLLCDSDDIVNVNATPIIVMQY